MSDFHAIVIGGTSAIGSAICLKAAQHCQTLDFTYRSSKWEADTLASKLSLSGAKVRAYHFDVLKSKHDAELFVSVGKCSHIVYNVGVLCPKSYLGGVEKKEAEKVMRTNFYAFCEIASRTLPGMVSRGFGRIVAIGSVAGYNGYKGHGVYAASKAALSAMCRSLALETASAGVTINCVAPGITDTAMAARLAEKERALILAQVPIGRMTAPNEVADLVAYLCFGDSGSMTGATLQLSGGRFA